jgi:hypothetical protein
VNHPEQLVHQSIAAYLNVALPPDAWHAAIDSAGKASLAIAARLKARGGKRGTPDHVVLWQGQNLWLEVKSPVGRVSYDQTEVSERIRAAGGKWAIVRSIIDVEAVMRQFGVPLRATTMTPYERDRRIAERLAAPPKARKSRASRAYSAPSDEMVPF